VWLLLIATQWLFSAAIYRALDRRALFRESVERWGHGDPAAAYRSFADEAGEALAAVRRIRRIVRFFAVWSIAMLILVEWILRRPFPVWEEVLLGAALLVELAVMKPLGAWEEEQTLMGEGIRMNESERLVGNASALLLAVPCLALAVLLGLAPALLPDSLIAAFFHWLASLFNHPVRAVGPPPPPPAAPAFPTRPEILQKLAGGPPPAPSLLLQEILRFIGRALLVLLGLATLWFLIHPLIRGRRGAGRTPFDLIASIPRRLRLLLSALLEWMRSLGAAVRASGDVEGVKGLRAMIARVGRARGRRAPAPSASARRFVRSFFRLVRWAEGKGVPFSGSFGPLEYARLICAHIPEAGPAAEGVALLFERNQYSGVPLSGQALSAYYEGIRTVMKK
jgi:hypothetical protein